MNDLDPFGALFVFIVAALVAAIVLFLLLYYLIGFKF